MGIVFITEQKRVTQKLVEIYKKMQFMPILEPNPEYVTRQKMHISYSFSSEVVFAKISFHVNPKICILGIRSHIPFSILYAIYDL